MKDYKKEVYLGETKTELKVVKKPMYDMPSNFDLKGFDPINDILERVTHYMTDQIDEMLLKAIKEGYKYIITYSENNHFDKETGVYTFSKTMYPTNDKPNEHDMSAMYLQPVIDKLNKLGIDYKNMSYEETKEAMKGRL